MSAIVSGFSHFSGFLHHFALAKLATSGIRVKESTTVLREGGNYICNNTAIQATRSSHTTVVHTSFLTGCTTDTQ